MSHYTDEDFIDEGTQCVPSYFFSILNCDFKVERVTTEGVQRVLLHKERRKMGSTLHVYKDNFMSIGHHEEILIMNRDTYSVTRKPFLRIYDSTSR